jgi:hypothetical protein
MEMKEKMVKITQNLKVAQDKQKSYIDKGRTQREIRVGKHVFLKLKTKEFTEIGKVFETDRRYYGPFEILEMIGIIV